MLITLLLIASMADGDAAASRGDYAAAAVFYSAEVAADSTAYEARFQLARALSFSGKREDAIRVYSDILAGSPTNSDVLLGRGRVYAWMGKWKESEADLLAASVKSPTYADVWSALGDMYLWSDRPQKAVEAYGRLSELKPTEPAPLIARGRAKRSAADLVGARTDFEAARTRGADGNEIDSYLATLMPRVQTPEAFVPEGFHWSASASAGMTRFSPLRDHWSDYTYSIRRHFSRGSLAVEYLDARRFQSDDNAWALDAYVDLWNRAYANVRYQRAPKPQLYPKNSWRTEIFQGFGRGWELSGSYDHLEFGNTNTDMYGVGLGKYIGNFYLRGRTLFIPGTGFTSLSHRGIVRYYYAGNGDDYLELSGGWGRGGEIARAGNINRTKSESAGISFVKYLSPHWGMKLGASYGDDENSFVERGLTAAIYTRW